MLLVGDAGGAVGEETLKAALEALRGDVVDEILAGYEPLRALGERGRELCAEEVRQYLEHLSRAVSSADPSIFTACCSNARGRLEARGIPAECVPYSLHVIRRRCELAEVPMHLRALAMLVLDRGIVTSRAPR